MARLQSFLILFFMVVLIADAELRTRRSPQFSQASASAGSFGLRGPRRGFPLPPPPPPPPHFGPPRRQFGPQPIFGPQFQRPYPGGSINIAKSISISTGGSGVARSQASSQAGRFGK